jgi:hypothetical protein
MYVIDYHYFPAGYAEWSEFVGQIVNKLLSLFYGFYRVIVHSSKDKNSLLCTEESAKKRNRLKAMNQIKI